MPTTPAHPGVNVEEVPGGARPIAGADTSIAAFIGWTARGPADKPIRVESPAEFERHFGGLDARNSFGHSVVHFFLSGGRQAWIVRLAAGDGGSAGADAGGAVLQPDTPAFESALLGEFGSGGVNLLDRAGAFNLLCVPGETNPAVLAKLQAFCRARRAFLIADTPREASFDSLRNGPDPALTGDDGANAALYFPWVLAPDHLRGNGIGEFPPSAFVAGICARTDERIGVWKAPAGSEATVAGAVGLRTNLTDTEQGLLNALAVNCLRSFPDFGIVVWGARTLRGGNEWDSDWKYVPVRRLALCLERSIQDGIQWAVFEPNAEPLWASLRLSIGNFLNSLWMQGALSGSAPDQAYFVNCDRSTTTTQDVYDGIVNIIVGFAPAKPAEFIVLRIRQAVGADAG
jgi:hypothetical protein